MRKRQDERGKFLPEYRPGVLRGPNGVLSLPYVRAEVWRAPKVFTKAPLVFPEDCAPYRFANRDWASPEFWTDVVSSLPGGAQRMFLDRGAYAGLYSFFVTLKLAPKTRLGIQLAMSMNQSMRATMKRVWQKRSQPVAPDLPPGAADTVHHAGP